MDLWESGLPPTVTRSRYRDRVMPNIRMGKSGCAFWAHGDQVALLRKIGGAEMNIGEEEIISENTHKAHRNLLITALLVIVAKYEQLPMTEMQILSMPISLKSIEFFAWILLGYGLYNLIFHWCRDLTTWRTWYGETKTTFYIPSSGSGSTVPALIKQNYKEIEHRVVRLKEKTSEIESVEININEFRKQMGMILDKVRETGNSLKDFDRKIDVLDAHYNEAKRRFRELSIVEAYTIFIHNLLFPIALFLCACIFLYLK